MREYAACFLPPLHVMRVFSSKTLLGAEAQKLGQADLETPGDLAVAPAAWPLVRLIRLHMAS